MKIVLASNNKHKIEEIKQMLNNQEILTLKDIGYTEEIEETGKTFLENALIKARTISKFLTKKSLYYPVIADDSGLCVEALNGEPGVYSARYSGTHGNDEANRLKLLNVMKNITNRKAYFQCVIVEYFPDKTYKIGDGKTYGNITTIKIGKDSFGYDCLFLSDDLQKTFGEASSEEKNHVSHRYRALKSLLNQTSILKDDDN